LLVIFRLYAFIPPPLPNILLLAFEFSLSVGFNGREGDLQMSQSIGVELIGADGGQGRRKGIRRGFS